MTNTLISFFRTVLPRAFHSAFYKAQHRMLFGCVALMAVVSGPAQAGNNSATPIKDVYKLPTWVDQVQRVCPWKSKAGSGYIRVIRTEVNGRHGMYLQWIRKGIAGAPTQPTSTILVEELAEDYQVRLEMPRPSLKANRCELTSMAENISTERRYKMHFVLRGPGDYNLAVTRLYEGGL